MKIKHIIGIIAVAGLLLSVLLPQNAEAIPAFARQYKISCSTCHAPIPKLKPYGDEFAGNGFILKEEINQRNFITAGDDILFLNRTFPIAARFDAFGVYEEEQKVKNDLQVPWGIKLLSGGPLYKNIGYYFYFYMSEKGEVAGIEDAYIHFNNIFSTNLDVMVGQFQTSDPLMKRELRLEYEDYMIYKTRVGYSQVDLTYDRGLMLTYGINRTATDLVGMVVNGNGKGEADPKFDYDNNKNFGLRVSQGITEKASIGGFVYYGKEKLEELPGGAELMSYKENEVTYYGPDVNVHVGVLEFTGEYLIRKDTYPFFGMPMDGKEIKDVQTEGIVGELIFSPHLDRSRFFLTGLYNWVDSDLNDYSGPEIADYKYKYHTATLSGTYLLVRNLRLMAEYTRDLENDLNRIVVGIVSAF